LVKIRVQQHAGADLAVVHLDHPCLVVRRDLGARLEYRFEDAAAFSPANRAKVRPQIGAAAFRAMALVAPRELRMEEDTLACGKIRWAFEPFEPGDGVFDRRA